VDEPEGKTIVMAHKIILVCQHCGKTFEKYPSQAKDGRAKFCSRRCLYESRRDQVTLQCPVCGKVFCTVSSAKRVCCSRKCMGLWQRDHNNPNWKNGGATEVVCEVCGKSFRTGPAHAEGRRFCSRECYGKYLAIQRRGQNNPAWRGGSANVGYGSEWTKELKRSIRERDEYRCAICGISHSNAVHHINYDKNDNRPENLITLCHSCHSKTNGRRHHWREFFGSLLKQQVELVAR